MKQLIIPKDEWKKTNRGITVVIGINDDCYHVVSPFGKKIEDQIWDSSSDLCELEISAPNGINIWEQDESGMETFREPTEDEWLCIKAGESPWVLGP